MPKAPATFTTRALIISPDEINTGETINFTVLVVNTGDLNGKCEVCLRINNLITQTEEVTLAGGTNQKVVFEIAEDRADTYAVDINGLSGSFVVREESPYIIVEEKPPAITRQPAPEPAPLPAPAPVPKFEWWIIGGVIGGILALYLVLYFILRKRKEAKSY